MHEILGIGNDLIEVPRIEKVYSRHGEKFLNKIFVEKEKEYCFSHQNPFPHLAARFAGKEAVSKAIGTGITKDLGWKDIQILRDRNGKPYVLIEGPWKERLSGAQFLITLSHTKEYASAFAILVRTYKI